MKVSVLVTTFMHERYIAQCLEGILAQRVDFPWEVIVSDDASTDGTREIVARYAERAPGLVHTHFPEENRGHGGNTIFREIVARARGEYIAYVDGDDYWTDPHKLARQAAFLDSHPGSSMCFHNVIVRTEDGSAPDRHFNATRLPSRVPLRRLLQDNIVAACSPMIRASTFAPLPEWYDQLLWGDWPVYMMAAQHGWAGYMNECLGVYRLHSGGINWGFSPLTRRQQVASFHDQMARHFPPRFRASHDRARAKAWYLLAAGHEQVGDLPAAREALTCSFAVRGLRPRPQDVRRLVLANRLRRSV